MGSNVKMNTRNREKGRLKKYKANPPPTGSIRLKIKTIDSNERSLIIVINLLIDSKRDYVTISLYPSIFLPPFFCQGNSGANN